MIAGGIDSMSLTPQATAPAVVAVAQVLSVADEGCKHDPKPP